MRLWSINPEYLDPIGLVALWREALLAKAVIYDHTKGYNKHPQLLRFLNYEDPKVAINAYLFYVMAEAKKRGYNFDGRKVDIEAVALMGSQIPVTDEQIAYELLLLKKKLRNRNQKWFENLTSIRKINPNPIFLIVQGKIEKWERVKDLSS